MPKKQIESAGSSYKQYVVSQTTRQKKTSVASLLAGYSEITVVNEFNDSTALVAMPEYMYDQLVQEHPSLIIEPNILYKVKCYSAF